MQTHDSGAAGDSRGSSRKRDKRPYQAPQLGRIDLEADRVLGSCHGGNLNVAQGGCPGTGAPVIVCAITS